MSSKQISGRFRDFLDSSPMLAKAIDTARPMLKVQTERTVQLDIWYLGLVYRAIQLVVVIWIMGNFIGNALWAKHDVPEPTVNS